MEQQQKRAKPYKLIIACIMVVGFVAVGAVVAYKWQPIMHKVRSATNTSDIDRTRGEAEFPQVDTSQLSPVRQRILSLAKTEFEAQNKGTKYSEGTEEAWCADFVSWVMREAGAPLKNGNTGGWRIPGTFTLQEYYESIGKFQKAGSGYQPKPGDVVMYNGSPIFGDHTNIVVQNNDGALVTVGGNEDGRIRVYNNTKKDYDGLLGYGVVD